jgi:hypothetical protein
MCCPRACITMLFAALSLVFPDRDNLANELLPVNITISKHEKTPMSINAGSFIELHGSLNGNPVYLMVEKTGKQQIAGYLFDGHGNSQYIYGEWFEDQLQVFDEANKRLMIILYRQ